MVHLLFPNRKMIKHWGTEIFCRRRAETIGRWILWAALTLAVAGGFGAGYLLQVAYRDGCVQPGSIAEALTPRNMECHPPSSEDMRAVLRERRARDNRDEAVHCDQGAPEAHR